MSLCDYNICVVVPTATGRAKEEQLWIEAEDLPPGGGVDEEMGREE